MSADQYFHVVFPQDVLLRFPAIHHLEALAIGVGLRLWGHHWRGSRIVVHCDNLSVVTSMNSGRVFDELLATWLAGDLVSRGGKRVQDTGLPSF